MSEEAAFSVTKQFHTIRGTDLAEFKQNVESLLGDGSFGDVASSFQVAFGLGLSDLGRAVENVDKTLGPVTVLPQPQSTVGGVPAPAPYATVPQSQGPAVRTAPPLTAYPGDCAHGARVYVDKPAKGRPWQRWECSIPWAPNLPAGARCKPENI